ncbi:hypothetical protein G5I_07453 [Acromyrmex echinatior]|uniref:Uncharacterized protein n=1 Tax=Acromyrmex echinatior TaxID=103372 RepID=F4WNU6_ACREC|nr:hypothetical protein G5I_07453 [Acromyrmex echinatior]
MPRLRARPNSPSPKTPSTTRQRFRPSDDNDDDDNDDDNDGAVRKSQTTRFAVRRTVYLAWRKLVVANTDSVACSSQNYTKSAENTNSGEQTASRVIENRHLYKFTLVGRTGDPAEILVASDHCPCPRGKIQHPIVFQVFGQVDEYIPLSSFPNRTTVLPMRKWRTKFFPHHSPRLKTRNYLLVDGEKEREGKGKRPFSLSGWWVLKNGNPIVSTAYRRSFTADTRKLTLNPKPGVSPLFLYESTPVLHILPDPFISFPQEYEKGREPSAE